MHGFKTFFLGVFPCDLGRLDLKFSGRASFFLSSHFWPFCHGSAQGLKGQARRVSKTRSCQDHAVDGRPGEASEGQVEEQEVWQWTAALGDPSS